jgi:hypothetical protein
VLGKHSIIQLCPQPCSDIFDRCYRISRKHWRVSSCLVFLLLLFAVNDKNYLNASFIPNICGGLVLHQVQLSCVHLNNADLVSPKPVPVLQSSFDLSYESFRSFKTILSYWRITLPGSQLLRHFKITIFLVKENIMSYFYFHNTYFH